MAQEFVRIKVGNAGETQTMYYFDLKAIESVDVDNRRVYTRGADQPYHISDGASWEIIMQYISQNNG